MQDYRFKVIAQLKDDLSENDRTYTLKKIEELQQKYKMKKIDDITFIKVSKDNTDFGYAGFFFFELEDNKNNFSSLKFYDIVDKEVEIAV